jgi:hypothetical protein
VRSAELASLRSIDPAKTRVDGGRIPDLLTVARQRAAKQLRSVDEALIGRFGSEGLTVSRGVLYDRKSVELVAKEHGAETDRDIRSVGWLFRRCLDTLALRLGFLDVDTCPGKNTAQGSRCGRGARGSCAAAGPARLNGCSLERDSGH